MSRIIRPGQYLEGPWLNHVYRDPFSIGAAIVTAASASSGVILSASAFFAASTVIGTVAVGALVAGAQYALGKTLTDKAAPFAAASVGVAGVNAPDARGSVKQSAPSKRWVYGRTRVGGAVSFLDTETPPFLFLQLLISARRISAVRGLRINNNDIRFNSVTENTLLTPLAIDGQPYITQAGASRLQACFRYGDPDQVMDELLQTYFPNLDSEFRQRAIATASFRFHYGADRNEFEKLWGHVAIPAPEVEVDGASIYDPRKPSHDPEDEDTWEFSRNAALIQADWMRQPEGMNFPVDRMDWDKIAEAADYDDEVIVNKDGTTSPRHQIDGVVTLNQKPRDVMEAMLTANRGFAVQMQGRGWVTSSKPRTPVLTIDDKMLLGGFEFRDDKAKRDTFNKVTSRFSAAQREYEEVDGPILERDDLIAEDGEVLQGTIRVPLTSDHRAVQRLQKQYLEESRLPRALTCRVRLSAICGRRIPVPGDCVVVYSDLYPRMNAEYTIEEVGFLEDFSGLTLSLAEYDRTISTDWDAQTDEQDFTVPELDLEPA